MKLPYRVLLALLAVAIIWLYNANNNQSRKLARTPIVVAKTNINPGDSISAAQIDVELWDNSIVPDNVIVTPECVIGKQAITYFSRGMPITETAIDTEQSYVRSTTEWAVNGSHLMTVQIPTERANGGLLNPGDRLDIYDRVVAEANEVGTGLLIHRVIEFDRITNQNIGYLLSVEMTNKQAARLLKIQDQRDLVIKLSRGLLEDNHAMHTKPH